MLTEFDFHILQLRYIKAAADQIGTYRPDGLKGSQIQDVIDAAKSVRQTYINAKADLDLGRGEYREAVNNGHDAAIGVYAALKSRYRKDPGSLSATNALPVDDRTAADTIKRMEQTLALWGKLPQIGNPAAEFVAWQDMDKAAFGKLLETITTQGANLPAIDQAFEVAEGKLHESNADMADLVTASLEQGRAQFPSGADREVIDAIPTEPASHAPNQPVISASTSPGGGKVHLEFDADHATSFDVLQKAPGASVFTKVVDDGLPKTYDATGLAAGAYQYQIVGRNSLGDGPASAPVTINVA